MCRTSISNSKTKQKLSDRGISFAGKVTIRGLLNLQEDFANKNLAGRRKERFHALTLHELHRRIDFPTSRLNPPTASGCV